MWLWFLQGGNHRFWDRQTNRALLEKAGWTKAQKIDRGFCAKDWEMILTEAWY